VACVAGASVSMLHSCASGLIKNSSVNLAAHRKVCKGFPGTCKFLTYPSMDSAFLFCLLCFLDFVIVLVSPGFLG